MDDIDVRIFNLSNKLASIPYQDPDNTQYISYLPSSEREISPVPNSGQDSPVSPPSNSSTSSRFSTAQNTSPTTSTSSRSPNYDEGRQATKRPNAIFSLSNKGKQNNTNKLPPKTIEKLARSAPKKKTPSIFLNVRTPQSSRPMSSVSPGSNGRLPTSPISKSKDVKRYGF